MKTIFIKIIDKITEYKVGLRTIKTAIAVFLCLLLQLILPLDSVLFAAIAAVVCMRETAEKSLDMGVQRFLGTLIGGIFGFLLINLVPYIPHYDEGLYVLIIPIGMIFCISVCVWANKRNAVIICCVVFLSIALESGLHTNTLIYVASRIIDTTIGVIMATLVNHFFLPYHPEEDPVEEMEGCAQIEDKVRNRAEGLDGEKKADPNAAPSEGPEGETENLEVTSPEGQEEQMEIKI